MPKISKNSIENIKAQVNLVDVVSPYVQLKQAGRSWTGLSPFTQENTPSFFVHPDKGFFKCFSTGEGGDCFSFIMKVENLEFYESVEFLSQKFNIPIQYEASNYSKNELSIRKQLFEMHQLTAEWFHEQFMQSKIAEPVRSYWQTERKFSLDIAQQHRIGFAPPEQYALAQYLEKKQFSIEALKASGLFFANERAHSIGSLKSRFRGRLMVPIRDINARVIAFTARQLEQTPSDDPAHKAKYVNSPETALFHKGKVLFGMDHARKHLKEDPQFFLVEGQLDAIRCWSVGLNTAIAPQGTAITEEQLQLMRRYAPSKINCLLDGDSAGRKAALRTLPLTFKLGLEFQYVQLPEKTDPDDLLSREGSSAFEPYLKNACGPLDLLFKDMLPQGAQSSTQEKLKATKYLFELVALSKSEIAQEDLLQKASKLIQISSDTLFKDFQAFKRNKQRLESYKSRGEITQKTDPHQKIEDSPLTQVTWELLYLILKFPQYGKQVALTIDLDGIKKDTLAGSFLTKLLTEFYEINNSDSIKIETIIESNEERKLLADIHTAELDIEEPIQVINECLQSLKKTSLNQEKRLLTQLIEQTDTNSANFIELMRKVKQINLQLQDVQNIAIQ